MNDALRPCPFCGGDVQPLRMDPADGIYGIFCRGCKAVVKWDIRMEARETFGENIRKWEEKWNARQVTDNA